MPRHLYILTLAALGALPLIGCTPDRAAAESEPGHKVTAGAAEMAAAPPRPPIAPTPPPAQQATEPPPTASPPAPTPPAIYPGVVIDRERGHVDLRGRVVGRAVEWLELLACRPGTREHEAIVTLDADAKHIHLALILLGLEPGTPARTATVEGQRIILPPQGPAVELYFVLDDRPDAPIPANQWVIDQDAGAVMPGNRWLFVGSRSVDHAGRAWFLAEQNGTLVSLVNFGDELIGRDTVQSEDGGNIFWTANTPQIPSEGTRLTLRIRPAAPDIASDPDVREPNVP